ncbi:Uncharacterised protein [Mycobacteroides abscessus]|nr:Uncharacterised protein [Mycobacteroides abscessus]
MIIMINFGTLLKENLKMQWVQIVNSKQLLTKLITSNIRTVQFFILKTKTLLKDYKIKCQTMLKTLLFGQLKQMQCTNLLFGQH